MGEKLIEWLDARIEEHKEKENEGNTSWDRGFHNGGLTEDILLRIKIREFIKCGTE